MKRTQIYLDENIFTYLEVQSELEGRTISDLIRQALEEYIRSDQNRLINQAEKIFGLWKERNFSTEVIPVNPRKERNPW